ncbi:MAG: archaeal proteasome endopeptidase complex subunit alpha [Candidatus Helarchaeota archaeon]|nr:archaeal proteasome endopeptidase complex subunit alpha [Candidatus Helarchaeota archaeon]
MQPHEATYDQAITIFSPEGRLFQVEYASEAIKQGTIAIGVQSAEGAALVAEKRLKSLQISEKVEKIFKIDEHIGCVIAGLTADAQVLIEHARVQAQINRLNYDEPIDVKMLVRRVCNLKQLYTMNAGVRPFGVAMLIAGVGVDSKAELYMTAPSGAFNKYSAQAIGLGAPTAREFLEKEYKEKMSIEETIILALTALKKVISKEFAPDHTDVGVIRTDEKVFRIFSGDEKEAYMKKIH